jgi:hypothetical protein
VIIYADNHLPGSILEVKHTLHVDVVGDWYNLTFGQDQLKLHKFLDTMIIHDVETRRIQAMAVHEEIINYETDTDSKIDLMNAITILDKTFTPPTINKRCGWQRDLLDSIIFNYSTYVIQTCRSAKNLKEYFKYAKTV